MKEYEFDKGLIIITLIWSFMLFLIVIMLYKVIISNSYQKSYFYIGGCILFSGILISQQLALMLYKLDIMIKK